MCQYWKKLHTCNHLSDRKYIEMCRPGYLSNTVCPDIDDNLQPRTSHFPCWPCIKQSVRDEAQDKQIRAFTVATAAKSARELAARQRAEDEKRAREERVRREAKEKAERERVYEQKIKLEREKEMERAKKEGGTWMLAEASSGKKKKVKGPVPASPVSPASPVVPIKKGMWKENEKGTETIGRAGTWGPKKILSRKEGVAVLASVVDGINGLSGANGMNGVNGVNGLNGVNGVNGVNGAKK